MKIQSDVKYEEIISVSNLFAAWQEFMNGKRNKPDVKLFAHGLIDNILQLHDDLANQSYRHGGYACFNISDPKPRNISKAPVRDRLLHHALHRKLYPFFEKTFIADSYSCQVNKGTHRAIARLQSMYYSASKNGRQPCWVLKCDIRKFFASIDHGVMLRILDGHIPDKRIVRLFEIIIRSFESSPGTGLPLGNLTSQLLVNVYMNQFDQHVKHVLKARHYIRYADDFCFLSSDKECLLALIPRISGYLGDELKLGLHPNKVMTRAFHAGLDFLGWVNFPAHRVLRTATKKRMFRNTARRSTNETLQSYLGLLKHGNAAKIRRQLLNSYWLAGKHDQASLQTP